MCSVFFQFLFGKLDFFSEVEGQIIYELSLELKADLILNSKMKKIENYNFKGWSKQLVFDCNELLITFFIFFKHVTKMWFKRLIKFGFSYLEFVK